MTKRCLLPPTAPTPQINILTKRITTDLGGKAELKIQITPWVCSLDNSVIMKKYSLVVRAPDGTNVNDSPVILEFGKNETSPKTFTIPLTFKKSGTYTVFVANADPEVLRYIKQGRIASDLIIVKVVRSRKPNVSYTYEIKPKEIKKDEPFDIIVTLDPKEDCNVKVIVDVPGVGSDSNELNLVAGKKETLKFTFTPNRPGRYKVHIKVLGLMKVEEV